MRLSAANYKRVVLKIGSSLFCAADGTLDPGVFNNLSEQVISLVKSGKEVIIVSSGAIALGMKALGLKSRPKKLFYLQAAAAIGQNALMEAYRNLFGGKIHIAQVLLTWDDFTDRRRYLNAKNTLAALLKYGCVPIVNENDTVSTEEIKFGDNDRLSALVAGLACADFLIILSDVDGLLDRDKKRVVRLVDEITPEIKGLACPTSKKTCVGGMVTKIEAARIAMNSGIPCVIANGRQKDIITCVVRNPESCGTLFVPKKALAEKERWIAFGTKPRGRVIVDSGARTALTGKKSLLSVGVVAAEGDFEAGDIVGICDRNEEFARGKVNLSSRQLEKIKGSRYEKEVIHRDNIVILC